MFLCSQLTHLPHTNKRRKKNSLKNFTLRDVLGLPWWLSGKESTYQCPDLIPDPGRSHVPQSIEDCPLQLLSLNATTTEVQAREPEFRSKRSHHNEKPTHCSREEPLLAATREKSMQKQRPSTKTQKQRPSTVKK